MKLVVYVHWSHIKPKEILNIEKPHVYSYIIKHTHGKTMRQTDYLHYLTKKSPRLPLGRQCDASLQATSVMAKSIHCTSVWERERQRRREGRGRRMTVSSFFKNRGGRSELLSRVTPYTHTHAQTHTQNPLPHTHTPVRRDANVQQKSLKNWTPRTTSSMSQRVRQVCSTELRRSRSRI